jgi:TonB family protein
MRSIDWKLIFLVSALHVVVLLILAYVSWQPLDHANQSNLYSQVIELRSSTPANTVAARLSNKHASSKSFGVSHQPAEHVDALSIAAQGNEPKPTAAAITPPSPNALGLSNPKPAYPISSRENGEQGSVLLYACITDHGKVDRVDLAQSSGYPALDRSALNTVRHWSFRPAQVSGKSIPMCYRLLIRFILSSSLTAMLA